MWSCDGAGEEAPCFPLHRIISAVASRAYLEALAQLEPSEQDSDEQGDDEFEQSKRKALAQEEAASDWI